MSWFRDNVTMGQGTITLTNAEMKKVLVVEKILDGHMTNVDAAALLGITPRQVILLKKKYMQEGPSRIEHQNRGRKPFHA